MRFCTSIAEYNADADAIPVGSSSDPFSDRVEFALRRATLSEAILGCFFSFTPTAIDLVAAPRLRCFRLMRRADDCRLPPLRFECLAKIMRLRFD